MFAIVVLTTRTSYRSRIDDDDCVFLLSIENNPRRWCASGATHSRCPRPPEAGRPSGTGGHHCQGQLDQLLSDEKNELSGFSSSPVTTEELFS